MESTLPRVGLLAPLYVGELAEPVPEWGEGPGLLAAVRAEQSPEGEQPRIDAAMRAKVPALFAHFGIDAAAPNAWELLALSLAQVHVPGFTVGPPAPALHGPFGWSATWHRAPPLKRGRGRPAKVRGLLHELLKNAPAKPAHRPPTRSTQEKRAFVAEADRQIAAMKAAPNGPKTDKDAAAQLVGAEHAGALLAVRRRFRLELARAESSADKSAKFSEAAAILQSFGRST